MRALTLVPAFLLSACNGSSGDAGSSSANPSSPLIALQSLSRTNSRQIFLTISDCSTIGAVIVNEGDQPSWSAGGWQDCTTTPGAISYYALGDGTRTLKVWSKDTSGNVSSTPTYITVTIDSAVPQVTLNTLTGGQLIQAGSVQTIGWTATDDDLGATPIQLQYSTDGGATWTTIASGLPNTGSYAWTVPTVDSQTARVQVLVTDGFGNIGSASSSTNFSIDNTPPAFSVGQFTMNGGASTTKNPYAKVSFQVTHPYAKVTAFCLKVNQAATPSATDPCWIAVNAPQPGLTPATQISVSNFPVLLGYLGGTYTVNAWAKDEVGNISTLSNGGIGTNGTDAATASYVPASPSSLASISATVTATPASPLTSTDTTAGTGATVYIKWNVQSSNGLPSRPINISYTTDDVNYTTVPGSPFLAGSNNSCATDASHNGCYTWVGAAPGVGYFRFKISLTDNSNMSIYQVSNALNAGALSVLAGNTESNLNAPSSGAVLFSDLVSSNMSDPGSLAVASNGVMYFRDSRRGILTVNPADGTLRLMIPATGTSSGDGGAASAATLNFPYEITIDSKDRLLIFDSDRIRRVDPITNVITTLIGTGSVTTDGVGPLSVKITSPDHTTRSSMVFAALPNGDIYFQSEHYADTPANGARIRVYKAAGNVVQSINISGVGFSGTPAQNVASCQLYNFGLVFDPNTSAVSTMLADFHRLTAGCGNVDTYGSAAIDVNSGAVLAPYPPAAVTGYGDDVKRIGRDGNIYVVSRRGGKIVRYVPATNSWVTVVGNGVEGVCADGTPALSCAIDPFDLFVGTTGQIFFVDRGRVRWIDAAGRVQTIMGQSLAAGDGGNALSARFRTILNIDERASGPILVLDREEFRFREFTIGSTISTIVGNGTNTPPATATPAGTGPLAVGNAGVFWDDFVEVPTSGDIYFNRGNVLSQFVRSTNRWVDIAGGGATGYDVGDGHAGSQISFPFYFPSVIGWDGSNILVAASSYDAATQLPTNIELKLYSSSSTVQSSFAGLSGDSTATSYCADGTPLTGCTLPPVYGSHYSRHQYDSYGAQWLGLIYGRNAVRKFSSGVFGTLATLAVNAVSFTYRHDATNSVVYYCGTDGRLHKKDLAAGGQPDTALAWPITSMSCSGRNLIYNAGRNSLIFPFTQNGMMGVGEYSSP